MIIVVAYVVVGIRVAAIAGHVGVAAIAGVTTEVRVAGEAAHVEVTNATDVTASPPCQCLLIKYGT